MDLPVVVTPERDCSGCSWCSGCNGCSGCHICPPLAGD